MSDSRRHLVRVLIGVLAWALVAGGLVGLGAEPASAKVPRTAFRYSSAIEPLAGYVGQSVCSPVAKPGTTAFANLLLRTYRTSRSLGISRSCSVGGTSEHKEGRAFDWGVSVHKAGDRRAVRALMHWLLKRDAHGNRYAMARRLGIQYMIWNRRIWGSYAASSGWRRYTGANPHTDHVHFSLSWSGARKRTSFWNPRRFASGSGAAPSRPTAPAPDRDSGGSGSDGARERDWPEPQPDGSRPTRGIPAPRPPRELVRAAPVTTERLTVRADRRGGTLTRRQLVAGHRYLVEASGTYRYDRRAGSVADAECSTRSGSGWWQRERSLRADEWDADHLDLYVDGHDILAQGDDGEACDDAAHTYRWVYRAERTGRVPFAVWDPNGYRDNSGRLEVRLLDLGRVREAMTWTVPARSAAGTTSPGLLPGGRDYLVTVSGSWRDGRGATADAECAVVAGDTVWRRDTDSFDMLAGGWDRDSLAPHVGGVRTEPVSGGSECDPDHTYAFVYRPDLTTPLNVRVSDPFGHGDNTGALTVSVQPHVPSAPAPAPVPVPLPEPPPEPLPTPDPAPRPRDEKLAVSSRTDQAVRTEQEYAAGTGLRIRVSGVYLMREARDWIAADAECTSTWADRDWDPNRFEGIVGGERQPLGDLLVNGALVSWQPSDGDGSCDGSQHVYTLDLTTEEPGPLWFVVADDVHGDNRGSLQVEVTAR